MRRPAIAAKPAPARTPMAMRRAATRARFETICWRWAPRAIRMPISRRRSVTVGEDAVEAGGDEREGEKRESAGDAGRRRWRLRSSLTT